LKNDYSNPIAFHFNGKSISKYSDTEINKIKSLLESNSKNNYSLAEVGLFTYDDKMNNPLLLECTDKLGLEIVNLATPDMLSFLERAYPLNENYPHEKFTLLFKILSLYHYIEQNNFNKKYYYLLDQSDVYLVGNPEEKIDILRDRGCHILYGAESRCMYWPMLFRLDERYSSLNKFFMNYTDVKNFEERAYIKDCYSESNHSMCFLNGGASLGETEFFMEFIRKYLPFIKEFINVNEQTMMHHFHFCYYPDIQIDHKCEVFQCAGPHKVKLKI
jgi:hypothetical protein